MHEYACKPSGDMGKVRMAIMPRTLARAIADAGIVPYAGKKRYTHILVAMKKRIDGMTSN